MFVIKSDSISFSLQTKKLILKRNIRFLLLRVIIFKNFFFGSEKSRGLCEGEVVSLV